MKYLFVLLFFWPMLLFTQVEDDFSDGDFTQNPSWSGSQEAFVVNSNFQLQLSDSEAGLSVLSTPSQSLLNSEWRFWVKLAFSPSSNNNARVYLVSDNPDIAEPLNGYFLQMGESGSSDAIELFRQEGTEVISICRGTEGLISSSFEMGIKITHDENGLWKVFADNQGGENYSLQAEGTDKEVLSSQYFGFYCQYTISNSSKFYFDNVYAGDIVVDNEPPVLLAVEAISDSSLSLSFDEVVEESSAENVSSYSVNNGFGEPIKAVRSETNATIVTITFAANFEISQINTLSVNGVEDLSGNAMQEQEMDFVFFMALPADILINEIMADPSPAVGLPEWEYLELYNSLPHNVNLNGWKLLIGSSTKTFENVEIVANDFLIIAKQDAETSLSVFGNFYGFGSFSLTNSGQDLVLQSPEGREISAVSYSPDWYNDYEKEDGGWSLEMINPENICSESENWTASNNSMGGSPGSQNSVYSNSLQFPYPLKLEMLDSKKLQITFNQKMDSLSVTNKSFFVVDNGVGEASSIFFSGFKPTKAILSFQDEFVLGETYEIILKKDLENCKGMRMEGDTSIVFGIPQEAENMDVVINEVLFNPLGDGVDFVELYNPSSKIIDLSLLVLGSVKISPPNPPDTSFYTISEEQLLFIPGDYLCLTTQPAKVKEQYFTFNPQSFLKMESFPSLTNDEGSVLLKTKTDTMVDAFDYNDEMHYPLLVYTDGVSLERISFLQSGKDKNNWHSAAESVGFATPAYRNSQYVAEQETDGGIIIDPEIFSPDNDGYNDLMTIKYKFSQPGFMMNVDIFNSNGIPVRKLVNNQYLGTEGSINWDGIKDDNTKAEVGIYIVYITVFDLDGNVTKYKKTTVLASKL